MPEPQVPARAVRARRFTGWRAFRAMVAKHCNHCEGLIEVGERYWRRARAIKNPVACDSCYFHVLRFGSEVKP